MRKTVFLLSLLVAVSAADVAFAHAHLDHASPAVGSTVVTAPQDVTIWFTQNLEPAFSSVEVTSSSGASVTQGAAQIGGNTMRVGLKTIGPGSYEVHWKAVSVDTHKTEGTFSFTVDGH
jgi:copper resistance protein C